MTRWIRNSAWVSFGLVVVLVGFFFVTSSLVAQQKQSRPAVGDVAEDFELKTLETQTVKLSKLCMEGPVVLVVLRGFPGYQCPVCNGQVGQFIAQSKKFEATKSHLVFVYPGPADGLMKHADEFVRGKTLPKHVFLALDPNYDFTRSYRLRWDAPNETAYPSTFVIDRGRKIRFAKISQSHGGRASADEVLKALQSLDSL